MSLAIDVLKVGVAMMALVVAVHFVWELIDYTRGR
jgi:hypothetical protein